MTKPVTRTRFLATYNYPGSFFPESTTKEITAPTFATAVAEGPDEAGYFKKDGWYSVEIISKTEKMFTSGDDIAWVPEDTERVLRAVVGTKTHYSEIEDDERNRILISNIKSNSKDGFGVETRRGNWQIADDYDLVVDPEDA